MENSPNFRLKHFSGIGGRNCGISRITGLKRTKNRHCLDVIVSESYLSRQLCHKTNSKMENFKKDMTPSYDNSECGVCDEMAGKVGTAAEVDSFELEDASGKVMTLHIYPFQLGRLGLIARRLLDLNLALNSNKPDDVVERLWTVCAEKPKEVAEIIAIATLRTKKEIDTLFEERVKLLLWSPAMTTDAFCKILYRIVSLSYYADFVNAIRVVRNMRLAISADAKTEHVERKTR